MKFEAIKIVKTINNNPEGGLADWYNIDYKSLGIIEAKSLRSLYGIIRKNHDSRAKFSGVAANYIIKEIN